MALPGILLVAGSAITAMAVASWREGGKRLALSGATLVAFAAYMLFGAGGSNSAWLVLGAVVALQTFATVSPVDWRRPEILLLGATAATLWVSFFTMNLVPTPMRMGLLVVVGLLAAASVASMALTVVRGIRTNVAAPPKAR